MHSSSSACASGTPDEWSQPCLEDKHEATREDTEIIPSQISLGAEFFGPEWHRSEMSVGHGQKERHLSSSCVRNPLAPHDRGDVSDYLFHISWENQ